MKRFSFALVFLALFLVSCDQEKVTSLVLNERVKTMTMGDTAQLEVLVYPLAATRNAKITWESSNESIVSVSDNGTIIALTPGEATVGAVCGKVFAECKITVLAVKTEFSFHSAVMYFLGDTYGKGTNNIVLRLLDDGLIHNGAGAIGGEGFFLNISLNQQAADTFLVDGAFSSDTTGKAFTFFPGSNVEQYAPGTYLGQMIDQSVGAIFVKSGEFNVSKTDGEYDINISFLGEKGEVILGKYAGQITAFDASESEVEENPMTFLSATAQEVVKESNTKQLKVLLKNETDSLQLFFNVANSVSNSIPVGTYTVSSTNNEFSLLKGDFSEGTYNGCWLLGIENFSITSGDIEVTKDNSTYNLTYNLRYENTRIIGNYSGIIYFDAK